MIPGNIQAIVMGASAGALEALSIILPALPANYPLPIMVVVHITPHKDSLLAEILNMKCAMKVCEAQDKEFLKPGTIYIAPPDYHLLVEKDKSLSLSNEEEVLFSRPSIDVLFETAADAFGPDLVGVLLTGANEDGAKGLKTIENDGGQIIVQDPENAHVPIMPEAAIKVCKSAKILNLQDISMYLSEVTVNRVSHAV